MAHVQLALFRSRHPHSPRHCIIRRKSPLWDLCTVHGGRSHVWPDGGDLDEGFAHVSDPFRYWRATLSKVG